MVGALLPASIIRGPGVPPEYVRADPDAKALSYHRVTGPTFWIYLPLYSNGAVERASTDHLHLTIVKTCVTIRASETERRKFNGGWFNIIPRWSVRLCHEYKLTTFQSYMG